VMPVRRSVWVCAATWGGVGVCGCGWVVRWFCCPFCYCMSDVLAAMGCSGLLVSGGLLSKGHLVWLVRHRANTVVLCLALAWQPCDIQRHSGLCSCVAGVGCCVAVRRCRSVLGCGALRHRSGRCVGGWALFFFFFAD
jgi:hypothetical protein